MKDLDLPLFLSVIILISFGMIGIYSAEYNLGTSNLFDKQFIWALIGIVISISIMFFSPKNLFEFSYVLYFFLILSLLYVIFLGSIHMGARRWIGVGSFQLQPSEIGKLIIVFLIARIFSEDKLDRGELKPIVKAFLLTLLPVVLIFKQPDLGTSLVYIAVFVSLLFAAETPLYFLFNLAMILFVVIAKGIGIQVFITLLIAYAFILYKFGKNHFVSISLFILNFMMGISSSVIWGRLKDYQKMRIITFLNPEKYFRDGGWQLVQSKITIANGSFFGKGFLHGSQTQLCFLPEGHTDFIFSVLTEEFGSLGSFIILFFYFFILYRIVKIANKTNNRFYSLIAFGIASIFLYQIIINIGMTIGLMPITGLPLPFLSYGGSSMIFNMIMIGVILSINKHRRDF